MIASIMNRAGDAERVKRAISFCMAAHSAVGQKRKYTGEEYFNHPIEVASMVATHSAECTDSMLIAALLHDVVEDTQVPIWLIADQFGQDVADLVSDLTDVSRPDDGNRAIRKEIDRQHTALASPQAKTIKLADLISNTRSITARDPKFAATYLAEKRLLLEALEDGDECLFRIAEKLSGIEIGDRT